MRPTIRKRSRRPSMSLVESSATLDADFHSFLADTRAPSSENITRTYEKRARRRMITTPRNGGRFSCTPSPPPQMIELGYYPNLHTAQPTLRKINRRNLKEDEELGHNSAKALINYENAPTPNNISWLKYKIFGAFLLLAWCYLMYVVTNAQLQQYANIPVPSAEVHHIVLDNDEDPVLAKYLALSSTNANDLKQPVRRKDTSDAEKEATPDNEEKTTAGNDKDATSKKGEQPQPSTTNAVQTEKAKPSSSIAKNVESQKKEVPKVTAPKVKVISKSTPASPPKTIPHARTGRTISLKKSTPASLKRLFRVIFEEENGKTVRKKTE